MDAIRFFTRPGCHLCEDGEWMLEVALRDQGFAVEKIDISTDAGYTSRYGTRIPVLHHPALMAELDWPFTPEQILNWLKPLLV